MMKTKSLDVYFVQETWLEGDAFDKVINGYHVFRHNEGKGNHRDITRGGKPLEPDPH